MKSQDLRTDFSNLAAQTKVYFYKSRGPGGQRRNKKETAVRLRHLPSGISAVATEFRSQAENKELAFRRLKKRLLELTKKKKVRKPTKFPSALKENILRKKKIRSQIKKLRRPVRQDEEF